MGQEHLEGTAKGPRPQDTEAVRPRASSERVEEAALQRLLRCILEDGVAASRFVVLRNGELLPDAISGTDLDVATLPGTRVEEVVELIAQRGKAAGWHRVCVSRRPHMTGFALASCADLPRAHAIHFDVFENISFLCLPLISSEVLCSESFTRAGVRQLSGRGRALATTVHHIAWSGRLQKEKYRAEVEAVLATPQDRDWFLGHVDQALGPWVTAELRGLVDVSGLGKAALRRRWAVARGLWVRWVAPRPLLACRRVARYVVGQLESLVHPPGIVGCPGDVVPGVPGARLGPELACKIAPHGFAADTVRGPLRQTRTLNGPRYEASLAVFWRRWTLVRWLLPSLFLWVQAKRNRVVVIRRLPFGLRVLRGTRWRPDWLAAEDCSTAVVGAVLDA
jgi:hypothetical protein